MVFRKKKKKKKSFALYGLHSPQAFLLLPLQQKETIQRKKESQFWRHWSDFPAL